MRLLSTSLLVGCVETPSGYEIVLEGIPGESWRQEPVVVIFSEGEEVARVTESTTLELPSGDYTFEAWRGETEPDGMVGELWVADLPIGTLSETLTVTYTHQPGRLWVSSGESLGGFTAEQVEAGGTASADVRLDVGLVNDFRGFAFDRMGFLWAATSPTYGTRLLALSTGEDEPLFELSSPAFADFASISDLVFDEHGLWVKLASGDQSWHGLVGFSYATLSEALLGGSDTEVEPDWSRPIEGLTGSSDLELGPDGAMWLSFFDMDQFLRLDDPTDGGSGTDEQLTVMVQTPTMGEPQALRGPDGLAFLSGGDAVALFWTANALVPLPAAELTASGPHSYLSTADDLFVDQLPSGLVADGLDRVWLGNYSGDGVGQILAWEPGAQPEIWLVSEELSNPTDLVLDPRPR